MSSGFTVGALNTVTGSTNINNIKYSAWCWKAGGATVANTAGDINSQVSVNSKAGFSIVSYTGNNTVSQTVGHGLSKAPEVIILKNRERDNSSWIFFHSIVPASTTVQSGAALHPTMVLDGSGTAAVDTEDTLWNSTSSTFRVRPTVDVQIFQTPGVGGAPSHHPTPN